MFLKEEAKLLQDRLIKTHPPSDIHPTKGYPKMSLTQLEKYKVSEKSVCKLVENICGYRCDKCSQVFYVQYPVFVGHLKKCKGKSAKFNQVHFYKIRYHDCYICGTRMFCDTCVINAHANRIHSLNSHQYRKYSERESPAKLIQLKLGTALPNIVNSENYEIPNEMLSTNLSDMCFFSCDKCSFSTSSWHAMSTHNVTVKHGSGSRKFEAKYVKEAMYHRCLICRQVVYCDNRLIYSHIYKSHHVKMIDYKGFFESEKGVSPAGTEKETDSSSVKSQIKTVAVEKYFSRYSTESDKVPNELLTNEIGNYCEFVCYKCKHKSFSWENMLAHIKRKHEDKENAKYKVFERRYLSEARMHRCRLCSKALYCDTTLIKQHLIKRHQITSLDVYLKQYDADANVTVDTQSDKRERTNCISNFHRKNGYFYTFTESLGHLYCVECGYFASAYDIMRSHIMKTQHGLKEGEQINRSTIKSAILHECQVCFEMISCHRTNLYKHVTRVHGYAGLSQYSKMLLETADSK